MGKSDKNGVEISPFGLHGISKKKVYVIDSGRVAVSRDSGEANDILIRKMKLVDSGVFVKVYYGLPELMLGLDGCGVKVLCYVMRYLGIGCNSIDLEVGVVMRFVGYKDRGNVFRGIRSLVDAGVLAKRVGSEYWVNTLLLYNGKR